MQVLPRSELKPGTWIFREDDVRTVWAVFQFHSLVGIEKELIFRAILIPV